MRNSLLPTALTWFVLVAFSACDTGQSWKNPGPREVFDAFLIHWFRGEADLAFDYVLPADREALTAPLADVELPQKLRPKPEEMLVVADIENVYDIDKMVVSETFEQEPPAGQRVTLTLTRQDGSTAEADLVWSDGRWYVDLPLAGKI